MSTNSNDQGRAYEFAWIHTLYDGLFLVTNTKVIENSSFKANETAWNAMSHDMQEILKVSANSAIDTLLKLEPCLYDNLPDDLLLEFQKDEAGKQGDVRDIVIKRNSINWEIGLSIKHNHEAIKHSRLSHKLDFGQEWFGIPCSHQYWAEVSPVFDRLTQENKLA